MRIEWFNWIGISNGKETIKIIIFTISSITDNTHADKCFYSKILVVGKSNRTQLRLLLDSHLRSKGICINFYRFIYIKLRAQAWVTETQNKTKINEKLCSQINKSGIDSFGFGIRFRLLFFLWLYTYGLFCFRHFTLPPPPSLSLGLSLFFVIFLSICRFTLGSEEWRE